MTDYYGLDHLVGKTLNHEDDYNTCYPILDENGIVTDIVCSEFGNKKNDEVWHSEDGMTARFLNDDEEIVNGTICKIEPPDIEN